MIFLSSSSSSIATKNRSTYPSCWRTVPFSSSAVPKTTTKRRNHNTIDPVIRLSFFHVLLWQLLMHVLLLFSMFTCSNTFLITSTSSSICTLLTNKIKLLILETSSRPRSEAVTRAASHVIRQQSSSSSLTSASIWQDEVKNSNDRAEDNTNEIRPFHQNWYPITTISALDPKRPNPVQCLGKSLVVFQSNVIHTNDGQEYIWAVLDDLCSHRFAPLSEGRVVPAAAISSSTNHSVVAVASFACQKNNNIQCAYHGWEFDSNGTCQKLPQNSMPVQKARKVQNYPMRQEIGMLWVWMDPTTQNLAQSIPLPINPLLQKWYTQNPNAYYAFQRDLPYGMELLGENLIDLSHLPFAHHNLGGLRRELGQDLPTRMLSRQEKINYIQWEQQYTNNTNRNTNLNMILPTFQAEIIDAAMYDPILQSMAKNLKHDMRKTKDWACTISYFAPSHVRYRRTRGVDDGASHVELFMCPTSESRSRVFLFNVFESFLKKDDGEKNTKTNEVPNQKQSLLTRLRMQLIKRVLRGPAGHLMAHQIFDGDGIFLHKQGNRMRERALSYTNYSTPTSADIMLNAYRRYLDVVAKKTKTEYGLDDIANAVVGTSKYGDNLLRSEMLDRYNTHTKYCKICSKSLQKARRSKSQLQLLQTALIGAAGTSITALIATVLLAIVQRSCSSTAVTATASTALLPTGLILRLWAITSIITTFITVLTRNRMHQLNQKINSFLFEDYIHAEKD